ncbi:hypothetical protein MRX96_012365 [Rhipicephalus microplus]
MKEKPKSEEQKRQATRHGGRELIDERPCLPRLSLERARNREALSQRPTSEHHNEISNAVPTLTRSIQRFPTCVAAQRVSGPTMRCCLRTRTARHTATRSPVANVQGGEMNAETIDADDGCQRRRGWKSRMRGESYTSGNSGGGRALTEGAAEAAGNSGGSSEAAARVGRSGHGSALVANKIPAAALCPGTACRWGREGREGGTCVTGPPPTWRAEKRLCVRALPSFQAALLRPPLLLCCLLQSPPSLPLPFYLQSQAPSSLARPCQCTYRLVVIFLR